jgi:hypothetical protein
MEDNWGDPDVNESIILKHILINSIIQIRYGSVGYSCEYRNGTSGTIKPESFLSG